MTWFTGLEKPPVGMTPLSNASKSTVYHHIFNVNKLFTTGVLTLMYESIDAAGLDNSLKAKNKATTQSTAVALASYGHSSPLLGSTSSSSSTTSSPLLGSSRLTQKFAEDKLKKELKEKKQEEEERRSQKNCDNQEILAKSMSVIASSSVPFTKEFADINQFYSFIMINDREKQLLAENDILTIGHVQGLAYFPETLLDLIPKGFRKSIAGTILSYINAKK